MTSSAMPAFADHGTHGLERLDMARSGFGALLALLFARTGVEVLRSAWPQFRLHPSHVQ